MLLLKFREYFLNIISIIRVFLYLKKLKVTPNFFFSF